MRLVLACCVRDGTPDRTQAHYIDQRRQQVAACECEWSTRVPSLKRPSQASRLGGLNLQRYARTFHEQINNTRARCRKPKHRNVLIMRDRVPFSPSFSARDKHVNHKIDTPKREKSGRHRLMHEGPCVVRSNCDTECRRANCSAGGCGATRRCGCWSIRARSLAEHELN